MGIEKTKMPLKIDFDFPILDSPTSNGHTFLTQTQRSFLRYLVAHPTHHELGITVIQY